MKLLLVTSIFIASTFLFNECSAQAVSINNPSPSASAILDVSANNKGVLIPRMTSAQRTGIMTPAEGLLVYDIDTHTYWFHSNTTWVNLLAPVEIAYVYSRSSQAIPTQASVYFELNGFITDGFVHIPGSPQITINQPGIYKVNFSVSCDSPNQFALFLNNVVVPGSIYGSGAGTQQNNGYAIITAAAGDVLTLQNHNSVVTVFLSSNIGGIEFNVNASIMIEKL